MFISGCGPGQLFGPTPTPTMIPNTYSSFVELSKIQGPGEGIASLALSPDGRILAYGNYNDNFIHLVDVPGGEEIMTLKGHTTAVSSLAFSSDGQLLASTGTVHLPPDEDGTVRIWDVKTGEQLAVFETSGINKLAFSPDSILLGGDAAAEPWQAILWDVEKLSEKRTLNNASGALSFSPDGNLLAAGSRDELLQVVDIATGEEIMSLSGHEGRVSATAFNPNGDLLASGSNDKIIQLWDANTGEKLFALTGHLSRPEFLLFSPNGKILASLGSGVNTNVENGQLSISFSPEDQIIRLWDLETGKQVGFIEMPEGVSSASFNSDWTLVATGNGSGLIQLWDVKP